MTEAVTILDKEFVPYINEEQIQKAIKKMAENLNLNFKDKEVVFLGVLNGSFMFYADLARHITLNAQFSFIKVSSYQGTQTTGSVKELIGVDKSIAGKTVIIVEDIVDTGITIDFIVNQLLLNQASEIFTATLLFKKEAFKGKTPPEFTCFTIENKFVVGYGLDYDEYGRNLPAIYKLKT
ncbi:MAG: hypoxanthine phosphoribosyltransferase [Luteibaculaceae bacterium]